MGYDHVKLLAGVYDELNCFRHLVALYFLCESFPAKQAEDIKRARIKRFNIGGAERFIFLEKKGKEINQYQVLKRADSRVVEATYAYKYLHVTGFPFISQ